VFALVGRRSVAAALPCSPPPLRLRTRAARTFSRPPVNADRLAAIDNYTVVRDVMDTRATIHCEKRIVDGAVFRTRVRIHGGPGRPPARWELPAMSRSRAR